MRRYLDHIGQGHLWKSGPTDSPFWDFYKDWGWTGEQFVQLCNDGADEGFIFCGPARENAVEVVGRVAALGHEIIIITDRQFGSSPEVSQKNTERWLSEHGIEYDELVFSSDKTCVPTDMFVEDKWENFAALTEHGVDTYLITRPWNEQHGPHPKRINDIADYADIVETVTRQGYIDLAFA